MWIDSLSQGVDMRYEFLSCSIQGCCCSWVKVSIWNKVLGDSWMSIEDKQQRDKRPAGRHFKNSCHFFCKTWYWWEWGEPLPSAYVKQVRWHRLMKNGWRGERREDEKRMKTSRKRARQIIQVMMSFVKIRKKKKCKRQLWNPPHPATTLH